MSTMTEQLCDLYVLVTSINSVIIAFTIVTFALSYASEVFTLGIVTFIMTELFIINILHTAACDIEERIKRK